MKLNTLLRITAFFFTIVGAFHALRLIYGWQAVIGGLVIPMWISVVAVIIAWTLAYYSFKNNR